MALFSQHYCDINIHIRKYSQETSMDGAMGKACPHVLLVEESCVDRKVASQILKICNIQVTVVGSPQEALNLLNTYEARDVKLILTECYMPAMADCGLLKEVKTTNLEKSKSEWLEAGADDYIIKPFNLDHVPRIMSYI
ncbi:hypothetical protein ACP4OV_027625 [Aristida adscensionis]